MKSLLGMKHNQKPANSLISFIQYLEQSLIHPENAVTKDDLAEYVKGLISNFEHIETGKSLDERM
jgi:hypothetical protein